MTTLTMNSLNAGSIGTAASFRKPGFTEIRAAFPDMPALDGVASRVMAVASQAMLAAVPFVALGWLFIAR